MAKLFVIDNYDSFTHNLVQMFMQYDLDIVIARSDKTDIERVRDASADYLLISPGPGNPADAGISTALAGAMAGTIPILGVCLGMQCINEAMGGRTIRAPLPMHGKTCLVHHNGEGLFKGLPTPFVAARYHSLMVETEHSGLVISANSDDGVVMGIRHPRLPLFGIQFHPESFMTEYGFWIIENFLRTGPLSPVGKRKEISSRKWISPLHLSA